jgi:hypothetical protein
VSGFVSLPPAGPSAPPALADGISLGAFWPALSLATARAGLRVPTDITDQRLADALKAGALEAQGDLAAWAAAKIAAGAASLARVPDNNAPIGDEPRLVVLWRRAVHSLAMADLAESQRGPDSTAAGGKRAEQPEASVDDHRRDARFAIRDMLGISRTTVELL